MNLSLLAHPDMIRGIVGANGSFQDIFSAHEIVERYVQEVEEDRKK